MSRNEKIAAAILGAAAAVAVYRFFKMPEEERKEFFNHLKERTAELLDDADETIDKVNNYMDNYDTQHQNAWVDKLYILKKMFKDLYGSEKHFLL